MTGNETEHFPHNRNIPPTRSLSNVSFFKAIRSRPKNIFLLRMYLPITCGIILFILNAVGSDSFAQNLINGGVRVYPDGFEVYDKLSDEATINAVQFVENFLDDFPCDDSWGSQRCYDGVVLFAKQRQKEGTVLLAVATAGRYEVALNWCISMQRLGIENYMLVALDDESFGFFSGVGAPVFRLPGRQNTPEKKVVWIRRALLTYVLLRAGINVLVSDFDAISVKSPFKSSFTKIEDESLDIITTPSNFPNPDKNELPEECPKPRSWMSNMEWTHQPCMGWTFFRSGSRLIAFFEETLLYDVVKFRDDQIGFNCAIRRAGAVWREPGVSQKKRGMLTNSRSPKLTLLMLPDERYVRTCSDTNEGMNNSNNTSIHDHGNVEMYHCKGSDKELNARANGFWFLIRDWSNVRNESRSFNTYLSEITLTL